MCLYKSHDQLTVTCFVSDKMEASSCYQFVILVIALFIPGVAAFDAGDAIALVLGLVIGILGICACLGYYARRRGSA